MNAMRRRLRCALVILMLGAVPAFSGCATAGGGSGGTGGGGSTGGASGEQQAGTGEAQVYYTVTGEDVAGVLQEAGYRAEITTDNVGDPMILSHAEGTEYSILFYGCSDGPPAACRSLMFRVGFDLEEGMQPGGVNAWNRENRFGKAWLDTEDDPFLEMDINVEGGITAEGLRHWLGWWEIVLGGFIRHIGW